MVDSYLPKDKSHGAQLLSLLKVSLEQSDTDTEESNDEVSKGFMFLCVSPLGANIKCKLTTRLSRVGHHGPSKSSFPFFPES